MVVRTLVLAALLLSPAAGQYAGSAACAKCHPKQYASQSKSGHARALSLSRNEWAFGAGDQAVTFVSQLNPAFYLEHGFTYYARSKSMALTPGHSTADGVKYRTFDPEAAILRCFQCHSTGPLRLEAGSRVMPFEAGVRCESCHGPGEAHINSKGPIANPGQKSAADINDLCGACHRKISSEEYTNWDDAWNIRHQPVYLAQSQCFVKSAGRLSCFTCHDPHAPVSRSAAEYSATCQSCHPAVKHKTAAAKQSCTACHMPTVDLNKNLQFANHWIGIYAPGKKLRPVR